MQKQSRYINHNDYRVGHPLSRRQFITGMGAVVLGALTSHCGLWPSPSASDMLPTVALSKAKDYSRDLVRQRLETMLDNIGGIADVVQSGARVAVKVNLTGGSYFPAPPGVTAIESYMTHPEVVRALCELLLDAGAGKLFIVEAIYDEASFGTFGYADIASAINAQLIDLNQNAPYAGFTPLPVDSDAFIYDSFTCNPILEEIDAFVSVSKMKCHYEAGVTHSMKNLVGIVPVSAYRLEESHWWRSGLHGSGDAVKKRIPKIIIDLNRARPIHLAVIDGIMAAEGGEVPRGTFHPVTPGVLLAGKNSVATDAVATAVMGFDPQAEAPTPPFLRGDNHLNLAASMRLGTNLLEEINVIGETVEAVRFPFKPSSSM
jgi:uncharacterized protein (DUF362 family)